MSTLSTSVPLGSFTAWSRWLSRWPSWGTWRSWQAGYASQSFTSSAASLATWLQPSFCPIEQRWSCVKYTHYKILQCIYESYYGNSPGILETLHDARIFKLCHKHLRCFLWFISPSAVFVLGGSSWFSVWDPGLLVCGVISELADPGPALEGLHKATVCGALPFCLWAVALDWQFCPHLWIYLWLLPVLRLSTLHQLRPHRPVPQTLSDNCFPAGVCRAFFRPCGALLCLPNQVWMVWVAHLHPFHGQILRKVRPQCSPSLKCGQCEHSKKASGQKMWTDVISASLCLHCTPVWPGHCRPLSVNYDKMLVFYFTLSVWIPMPLIKRTSFNHLSVHQQSLSLRHYPVKQTYGPSETHQSPQLSLYMWGRN